MLDQSAINAIIRKSINEELPRLLQEVNDRTPEDTQRLLQENEIELATTSGNTSTGYVKNDKTPYAPYVEFGIGPVFNYHKPKGSVFYRGVGARMFTRALDATQDEITARLTKNIQTGISKLTK